MRFIAVSLRGLGRALVNLYGILVVGFSVGFVLYGETWRGRVAVLALALLALLPLLAVYAFRSPRRVPISLPWGVFIVLSLAFIVTNVPDGKSRPGSRVSNRFVDNDWPFPRYSPSNLVPEIEQIKLGITLAPLVDALIDQAQARRVANLTLPLYREMKRDPDFRRLGSVMGWVYAELWGGRFDYGHYYLYLPETVEGEKVPALIFLHGSAGNFKAYLWVWSRLGAARRMAIICPSFGFGNWYRDGGTEAIDAVVTHAIETLPIDSTHIYLVGLSNGGTGVSRAALATTDRYRGLAYISPIIEKEIVLQDNFVQAWRGRPVLVIHGDQDRRIPVQYVQDRVEKLAKVGVDVTYQEYANEDHFLLFSQPNAVLSTVQEWLDAVD